MNDIERAKELLKERYMTVSMCLTPKECIEQNKALDLAISALEKQISKGPIGNDNGSYAEYFESWLECPKCGEAIPEYTAENNTWCYCLGCGQKLDWEEENE